ncbi:MAG: hypothetical protein HY874_00505 [Chloroflexi bacterium]|nr:hypothetical protein [Chloroflexota bacterium]
MTLTLPRNVLGGNLLVVFAWGGAAVIAYGFGHRAEIKLGDYARCERAAWRAYRTAVAQYDDSSNIDDRVKARAQYDIYTNDYAHCAEGLQ